MAGDNAFVENMTMATPVPGIHISVIEDAYNFYLSQLRITIERAFGILVHRWGLLRRPLSMSILKVPAIVTCLMGLHNFCTDHDSRGSPRSMNGKANNGYADERNIQMRASQQEGSPPAISFDKNGVPSDLMGSGHHFCDEPGGTGRRPVVMARNRLTPMRQMMRQVAELDLRRPTIKSFCR